MKKFRLSLSLLIPVAAFFVAASAFADTSYLLIEGPFGAGGTLETFKWKIDYDAGTLITGQDLLNAVFGIPVANGTYTTYSGGFPDSTLDYYTAGNATQGVGYIDFNPSSAETRALFTESFTVGGATVAMDPDYTRTFGYFVAGGNGDINGGNPTGTYEDGAWVFSNDGLASRLLSDGSFDSWVFGPFNFEGWSQTAPTPDDFADATVLTVPEPGSFAFVVIGVSGIWALRRRGWLGGVS